MTEMRPNGCQAYLLTVRGRRDACVGGLRREGTFGSMAVTWLELHWRSRTQSWRRIRQLRSAPPEHVDGRRVETFTRSLEQAQQQFVASEHVSVESRAINLFYGLSQAGRAIACAYAPQGSSFKLTGHGIACPSLDDVTVENFPRMQVKGKGKPYSQTGRSESFTTLAHYFQCDNLQSPIVLSALWGMIVECGMNGLALDDQQLRPVLLSEKPNPGLDFTGTVSIPSESRMCVNPLEDLARLYPDLDNQEVTVNRIDRDRDAVNGTDFESYNVTLPRDTHLRVSYRDVGLLFPGVPDTRSTIHPLLAWWGILFALSMLTRYRPALWSRLVDVDESPYAVPLEFILTQALDSVPDLIAETLDAVAGEVTK